MNSTGRALLSGFAPGGFAIVMATGIVSIAAQLLGHRPISQVLFACNVVLYPLMWCAMVLRIADAPGRVVREFASHDRGAGFLTMVAATSVVGSQCAVFGIAKPALPLLLAVATLLWIVLFYGFLAAVMLQSEKPAIQHSLNGGWLLAVVATESLAVLGSYVVPIVATPAVLSFACLSAFLLGCMLYAFIASLIAYRFVFHPLHEHHLEGPWWINMGAMAIATLAGSRILQLAPFDVHVALLRQMTAILTLLCWITATAWIPLLLLLFGWKHVAQRRPLRYAPGQWSVVFPLGMYTASTEVFSQAAGLPFLHPIPQAFLWLAIAAWGWVTFGLVRSLLRRLT